MRRNLIPVILVALLLGSCLSPDPQPEQAMTMVRSMMVRSGFELNTRRNPVGDGWIVYVNNPERAFNTYRKPLWLVVEGEVFPLNGPAKDLTPALEFPRGSEKFRKAGSPAASDLVGRFYRED